MTVGPIACIFVLYVYGGIKIMYFRCGIQASFDQDVEKRVANVSNKTFFYALFVSFLILPGVSTTIFRMFSCTNIDPDSVAGGDNWYMAADRSISCSSSRYRFGLWWGIAMIFVYPIGTIV